MSKERQRGNGSGSLYKRAGRDPWYASWYDHDGKRRTRCTFTTDKQKALRMLAVWVGDAALRTSGVIDSRQEAITNEGRRPIDVHVNAFEGKMVAAKRSARHIKGTMVLVREVLEAGKFAIAADISPDPINAHLRTMVDGGAAARTVQARVVAIKSFVHWLLETDKISRDPLVSLRAPKVKSDRKMKRRMLLPDEWPWLISATVSGSPWRGVSPLERELLYATAIQSGLRSSELRSLTKADLCLTGERPHILCEGENTKNGERAKQYIQRELAERLRRHVVTKLPEASVFTLPDEFRVAKMLRRDLAMARKAWLENAKHDADEFARRSESRFLEPKNDQGKVLDFHSLRHTTGAWLAMGGVHPKAIQEVMRHKSITLTLETYGHLLPDQHADAVGTMTEIFTPTTPQAMAAGAEMIHGSSTDSSSGAKRTPNGASDCEESENAATMVIGGNLVKQAENVMKTKESEIASCRARTYDPLIKSQLQHELSPNLSIFCGDTDQKTAVRIATGKDNLDDLDAGDEHALRCADALQAIHSHDGGAK